MAITKFVSGKYSSSGSLKAAVEYVTDPQKTSPELIYSNTGSNDPKQALERMVETKKLWNKTGGRQCQHDVISFVPGEGSPELMLDFGMKYAAYKYGNDYEYILAVHTDKDHIHCHIVANSVSITNGKKHNSRPETLHRMRDFTDTYCAEHDLRITVKGFHSDGTVIGDIQPNHSSTFKTSTYQQLQKENSVIYNAGREIFEARRYATSMQDFKNRLKCKGIRITSSNNAKYLRFEDMNGNTITYKPLKETFRISCEKASLEKKFEENASRPGAKAIVYTMLIPTKVNIEHFELLLSRMPYTLRKKLPHSSYAFQAIGDSLYIISASLELLLMLFELLRMMIENQNMYLPDLPVVNIEIPETAKKLIRIYEAPYSHAKEIDKVFCSCGGSYSEYRVDNEPKRFEIKEQPREKISQLYDHEQRDR